MDTELTEEFTSQDFDIVYIKQLANDIKKCLIHFVVIKNNFSNKLILKIDHLFKITTAIPTLFNVSPVKVLGTSAYTADISTDV